MTRTAIMDTIQKSADMLLWLDKELADDQERSKLMPRREEALRKLRVIIQHAAKELEPEKWMDVLLLL